jgi:hypothetical protein
MGSDVFVPLVFFVFLAAIILVPTWLRERTRQSAHQLISQALEKGQPLDPEILRQLTEGQPKAQQPDRPRRTLGSGVVLLALALGFAGAAAVTSNFDPSGMADNGFLMIPAVILGALGVAFTLLAIIDYATKRKDQ